LCVCAIFSKDINSRRNCCCWWVCLVLLDIYFYSSTGCQFWLTGYPNQLLKWGTGRIATEERVNNDCCERPVNMLLLQIAGCIKAVKQRAAGQSECLLNVLRYVLTYWWGSVRIERESVVHQTAFVWSKQRMARCLTSTPPTPLLSPTW
jgi:hypothetical protein